MSYRNCKKCRAWTDQRPVYSTDGGHGFQVECLVYRCGNCGYVTREPTADSGAPTEETADGTK